MLADCECHPRLMTPCCRCYTSLLLLLLLLLLPTKIKQVHLCVRI